MPLPEDASITSIEEFFAEQGFRVVVHKDAPPEPSADELRRMPRIVRQALGKPRPLYWADLEHLITTSSIRWYAGGDGEETATRRARWRWRIEQEGGHAPSTDPGRLP